MVRIRATGTSFPGEKLQATAERALAKALRSRFQQVELAVTKKPHDLILPDGDIVLRVADLDGVKPGKRMAVWTDIEIDGHHYRTVPVWFSVTAWGRVISVNRDLEHHHVLEEGDFAEAVADVAALSGMPVMDYSQLEGQRLLRPLSDGAIVLEKYVEPAPMVQQGATVDVFAKAGRVVLRSKGVALSDGNLLQHIIISNPSSGEHYAAKVVGQGHVEVQ